MSTIPEKKIKRSKRILNKKKWMFWITNKHRIEATEQLGRFFKEAPSEISQILWSSAKNDQDEKVRLAAINAMGYSELDNENTATILYSIVFNISKLYIEKKAAIDALKKIGKEPSTNISPLLMDIAKRNNNETIRIDAVDALKSLGQVDNKIEQLLILIMNDPKRSYNEKKIYLEILTKR